MQRQQQQQQQQQIAATSLSRSHRSGTKLASCHLDSMLIGSAIQFPPENTDDSFTAANRSLWSMQVEMRSVTKLHALYIWPRFMVTRNHRASFLHYLLYKIKTDELTLNFAVYDMQLLEALLFDWFDMWKEWLWTKKLPFNFILRTLPTADNVLSLFFGRIASTYVMSLCLTLRTSRKHVFLEQATDNQLFYVIVPTFF